MLTRGTLLYIAQRLVLILFTLVAVSFLVFVSVHSLPGHASERHAVHGKALQLVLHEYGLDRPILVQYWSFLTDALRGNLGVSFQIRGLPITPLVMRELSVSAELGGTALLITIGLGTTVGVLAALRQNSWGHFTLTSIAGVGYSVPSFVLAGLGVLIFSYFLPTVTNGLISYPAIWTGTYGTIVELSLPAIILGFYTSGQVTRITRAAMLEVLQQDYIRTARAKGLKSRVVTVRHALRNALIPVISILGPLVISIITGSVIIENIFGIPGLGKEFVESILGADYNITVAVFTVYALLIGVANLVVDLLYTVVDPRIRY